MSVINFCLDELEKQLKKDFMNDDRLATIEEENEFDEKIKAFEDQVSGSIKVYKMILDINQKLRKEKEKENLLENHNLKFEKNEQSDHLQQFKRMVKKLYYMFE